MPQSREKTPPPITELPNPELNPLLNPTLGRNLGRWAEVYFTSPPEKREEAVVELLRELKASPSPSEEISENPPPVDSRFVTAEITRPENPLPDPSTKCVECGHTYANAQRFCGMCGAPMGTEHSGYRAAELPLPQEFVFPQSSIFGANIPAPTQASYDDGSDISWLREKNLAGDGEESSLRRFSKFATAFVAVAAIGVLIYAQSRPSNPALKTKAPAASSQPTSRSAENQPSDTTSSKPAQNPSDPREGTAAQGHSQPQTAPQQQATPEPPQPAATQPATTQPAPTQPAPTQPAVATALPPANPPSGQIAKPTPQPEVNDSTGNGSQELALAEDYLNGKRGPRDSAEAAKFLWKAVGKENPSAILLLSDMYLVGDGVPKSCDQARLLLNAAVRKNVPLAAQKLHNLLNSGCP